MVVPQTLAPLQLIILFGFPFTATYPKKWTNKTNNSKWTQPPIFWPGRGRPSFSQAPVRRPPHGGRGLIMPAGDSMPRESDSNQWSSQVKDLLIPTYTNI